MVAWSTCLALFSTLLAFSAAKDYLCGDNSDAKISRRGGSLNYGDNTNPLESPMLVQLVYADKKRECAGSLITVRHVLTARECVDGVKPEEISVIYGTRTPYGGNASVKSAKSPSDANADLAVLELARAVEISDNTIPVCVGDTSDEEDNHEYKGLHFGPKNKSDNGELARAMYQDVLKRVDEKECIEALGNDYHKDTQFCVGKRNMVFAEGVYTGGPILVRHVPSGRFLQVGIAIKADAENNYGSATRVPLYHKEIRELTGCFLTGAGLDSKPSGKQGCDKVSTTKTTTTKTTTRRKTTTTGTTTTTTSSVSEEPKSEYKKVTVTNYKQLGFNDTLEFLGKNDISIKLTQANTAKTKELAIKLTEEADKVLSFDVEYGVQSKECLNTTTAKFHFGYQYGAWSDNSPYFRVMMMRGTGDIIVWFEPGERLQITVDPSSTILTAMCGAEHGWAKGSVINSYKPKRPSFFTPQFYLDEWSETSEGCKTPKAQQFVKVILFDVVFTFDACSMLHLFSMMPKCTNPRTEKDLGSAAPADVVAYFKE